MTKTLDLSPRLTPEQAAEIRNQVRAIEEGQNPTEDANALRACRRRAELSQRDLADAVGRSVAIIKNIESGRTKLRGRLREALWRVVVRALEAKHKREGAFYPHLENLEALARMGRTKEDLRTKEELATENTMLAQRVAELEAKVTNLSDRLAEFIDTVRPVLEKAENVAAREGTQLLADAELK